MDTTDLDVIDIDGGTKVESKFNLMLQSWLKTKEPRTWKVLYEALRHPTVDMSVLAETLRINYIVKKQLDALYGEYIVSCSDPVLRGESLALCESFVGYAL